jgi:DNA ligase (NAD+)
VNDQEIQVIVDELTRHDAAYYGGSTELTDSQYDLLKEKLERMAPAHAYFNRVGSNSLDGTWPKSSHEQPMGSLLKVTDFDALEKWANKYTSLDLLCSEKLDGLSIDLLYIDGQFTKAITRGDGFIGEDITQNARLMCFPKSIPTPGRVSIRGEMMLELDVWKAHFPNDKNPRNSVSGSSRRLDGKLAEHISVYAYVLNVSNQPILEHHEMLMQLQHMGFKTPLFKRCAGLSEAVAAIKDCETLRESLNYEIDGIVVCENRVDLFERQGHVQNRPRAARAYKFSALEATSILRGVQWQIGRTGVITPVAEMDPVEVGGVTVQRASLANFAEIGRLGIGIGSEILIKRANDVIPKVVRALTTGVAIQMPSNCPSCGGQVSFDGTKLECLSANSCSGQNERSITYFLNVLDVKGFGPEVIKKLYAAGAIKDSFDLYGLGVDDLSAVEGLGEARARKLVTEFNKKARSMTLAKFLSAIGIKKIGESSALKILAKFPTLSAIAAADPETLCEIDSIGAVLAESIQTGLTSKKDLISNLLTVIEIKKSDAVPASVASFSFCFSGFRDRELSAQAALSGAIESSTVSAKLTYLVVEDASSKSSKVQKAQSLGVKIIGRDDFGALVGFKAAE